MPAPRKTADTSLVVAYYRVSTREQGDSGAGLDAQRTAVAKAVTGREWRVVAEFTDIASGKSTEKRPGLASALELVRTGQAGTLMVSKLDRLSRSLLDFAGITADATKRGWNLAALDLGFDLSTPTGRAMAGMLAVFAEWERETIGQRTRDALATRIADGVILGAAPVMPVDVLGRIVQERRTGATLQAIADGLNADGIPTARGGQLWRRSTVKAALDSKAAARLAAA